MSNSTPNYDYVIVGAGSAGSVLANRLSESHRVLLLEAGPKDHAWDFRLHMPAALSQVLSSDTYNWFYHSEPEAHLDGRRMYCPRGRVLGGSSSINGMIFVRGNAGDYARWSGEHGLTNWSYEHCLPYFQRLETTTHGSDAFRGRTGPMRVHRGEGNNPLSEAWLSACDQAGYGLSEDFNGAQQEGGGHFDITVDSGKRFSASKGYLASIRTRDNLRIETGAVTTRVLFEGRKAVGVEYARGGQRLAAYADAEVILCGGAINSPQLLMQSGIGPADHLQSFDIPVFAGLPRCWR